MAYVTITKENFENEVLKSDKPITRWTSRQHGAVLHGFADRGRDRKRA